MRIKGKLGWATTRKKKVLKKFVKTKKKSLKGRKKSVCKLDRGHRHHVSVRFATLWNDIKIDSRV